MKARRPAAGKRRFDWRCEVEWLNEKAAAKRQLFPEFNVDPLSSAGFGEKLIFRRIFNRTLQRS
jgi:hypothetical protein